MTIDGHLGEQVFVRAESLEPGVRVALSMARLSAGVSDPVRVAVCPDPKCWKAPGVPHWHVRETPAGLAAYPDDDSLLAICPGDHAPCPVTEPGHACEPTPF